MPAHALEDVFAGNDHPARLAVAESIAGALDRDDAATPAALRALLAAHPLFATAARTEVDALADAALSAARAAGSAAALGSEIARHLPSRAQRVVAFESAGRACLRGGAIDEAGAAYLESLQRALALRDDEAEALLARAGDAVDETLARLRTQLPLLLDTMAAFAYADGHLDERERAALTAALARIADARLLGRDGLTRETEAALARVKDRDPAHVIADVAAAVTDPSDRFWFAVYAHAVVLADGRQDPAEVRLLARLGAAFDLHPEVLDVAAERAREI